MNAALLLCVCVGPGGGGLLRHIHFEAPYSFIIHVIPVLLTPVAITTI
jgi:hypothetical protein